MPTIDRKGGGTVEVIALILFIIFMFATSNDRKKKKGGAAAGTQAAGRMSRAERQQRLREQRAAQAGARPTVEEAFEDAVEQLQRKLDDAAAFGADARTPRRPEPVARAVGQAVRQGEAMLADDECRGGSMEHTHAEGHSALEDKDCYGGSMEHTHTEGVSRSAHARRMAAIDSVHDEDAPPQAIDAAALRRAVVMAEVLGKPRALQARRRAG